MAMRSEREDMYAFEIGLYGHISARHFSSIWLGWRLQPNNNSRDDGVLTVDAHHHS